MVSEERRRGRPSVPKEDKKRNNLTFRTRDDLRDLLSSSAEQAGRSVSEEIEFRLRRSYYEDERITELFGSRRNFELLKVIASLMQLPVNLRDRGADWLDDAYLFSQVEK